MIRIVDYVKTYKHRATGWVQDSSSFSNLHGFVSIFSHNSMYRGELISKIQRLVEADLARRFLMILGQDDIAMSYKEIVGSAPAGSRKLNTVCDGIGQAALTGQKREYQGEWPTNNFLRWAEALQFVEYSPATDTYKITLAGEDFVKAGPKGQMEIIKNQLAMYPPAIRVLTLLSESEHTKFSMGERLGFIGEKGFTNISEKLFVEVYFSTDSREDRKSLKSDYEGSSDKYARQICSWLASLNLVEVTNREFVQHDETLSLRSYKMTPMGREFLRRANILAHRFVPFGMLSMEDSNKDKEYICKRRALILKSLSGGQISSEEIVGSLHEHGISVSESEVSDDILSLQNMGLNIVKSGSSGYHLKDKILGLSIPRIITPTPLSEALMVKERLRGELKHIDHNLLVIIDFAYGSTRTARLFEVYVAKAYEQIHANTFLLGGVSKPDVVVCSDGFVMIVDAKAYSGGFSLPQTERDKMVRYIEEYHGKACGWYKTIEGAIHVDNPIFQFVSSGFNGSGDKLADVARRTRVNGSAISAENLLRMIDGVLATGQEISIAELTANREIIPG